MSREEAPDAKGFLHAGFFLLGFFFSLSLFWPVLGKLMNYPNIYSVWKENTYHIYL